jgi:hypothetical protein
MNRKLNTLRMKWKSTRSTSPKKRLAYTLSMPTIFETHKRVQGDNLTHLLLAEPVGTTLSDAV